MLSFGVNIWVIYLGDLGLLLCFLFIDYIVRHIKMMLQFTQTTT